MKKFRQKKGKDSDEDDKLEVDYVPSDSDEELDEEDKLILKKTRKQIQGRDESESESEEEVMHLKSSSDDSEDDDDDDEEEFEKSEGDEEGDSSDEDSFDEDGDKDVLSDDEENLPNRMAWGQKRKNYYDTDYVDQDFGGFQNEKDEEAALMEEEEARAIQRRLVEQLDDLDPVLSFATLGDLSKVADDEEGKKEIIETDFSQMSKRDRLALLEKESPEFSGFIADFQNYLDCIQDNLLSIVNMFKTNQVPLSSGTKFVLTMTQLIMNYSTNISFYLLLKARHANVKNHPVLKQLMQYKELINEMEPIYQSQIQPQLESVLAKIAENEPDFGSNSSKSKKKRKLLNLLSMNDSVGKNKKSRSAEESLSTLVNKTKGALAFEMNGESDEDSGKEENKEVAENGEEKVEENGNDKRAITYQIAKNKGLTPHRKKENRNPRVKLKNKFRKAKIRRKGQVREVRREVKKYGGEMSGIKASASKSIKIKY